MLTWDDPLPRRPRRILVAGTSGAGKSTLAARVARLTGAPYTELDGLFHGPGWTPRPEFDAEVRELAASEAWVTEWQYTSARPILAARADLLIWLDVPFWRVTFPRVVRRTLRRRLRRERLWNGNVEPSLLTIFTDPEHIIRWSVKTRHLLRERVSVAAHDHPELVVVRLRSPREAQAWLARSLADAVGHRS